VDDTENANMKAIRLWAVVLTALLLLPAGAWGKPAERPARRNSVTRAAAVDQSQTLDVNRINMIVSNIGSFAYDLGGNNAGLEFPKGTGNTVVFAAGIWMGGEVGGEPRLAVVDYSSEFAPGIIGAGGVPTSPDNPAYNVYKLERVYDTTEERDAALFAYQSGAEMLGAPHVTAVGETELDILGDQMLWCVYNDADPENHINDAGSTAPLGIEVQQTTFGFMSTGALGQTAFVKYKLINKGGNTIENMYVSQWSDPDLGGSMDDLVGCDVPPTSLGYCYNATNNDSYYGTAPPAVGFDFFQGPIGYGGTELGMTSYNKYINGTDPDNYTKAYNFMKGLKADGTPLVNPVTGDVTTYFVSGDPVDGTGWLDTSPNDRRLMLSSGPFRMAPGDTQEVVVGLVIGDATDRLGSISLMRFYDLQAQSAFDLDFEVPTPPVAPVTVATPGPGSATLSWDSSSESYSKAPYEWEGYVVYQGASRSGPYKRIATFDRNDGITSVLDPDYDPESRLVLPTVKALGNDGGVQYKITLTSDAVRGGPLRVGTPYYYAVTAYSVGIGQVPQVLESPIDVVTNVYTVVPQTPAAGVDLASGGVTAGPTRLRVDPEAGPLTTDSVAVIVVQPENLVDADYRVNLSLDAEDNVVWALVRTTAAGSTTLLENQTNFTGDEAYAVVDGIQVKVIGEPTGSLLSVDYVDGGAHPPAYVGFADMLGLPFFDGSADYAFHMQDQLSGLGSLMDPSDPSQFLKVEIRLTGGAAGQKAYRYLESAATPRTYPYVDYVDVPFTAWDVDAEPARQLNCALFEWEDADPPANDAWTPDTIGADPFSTREWIYVFRSSYSGATPDVRYTTTFPNARYDSDSLDFMYVWWPAQALDADHVPIPADAGDVVLFTTSAHSPNDYFTFSTRAANRMNTALARDQMKLVRVVPNPYLAHSRYERNQFDKVVKFTHLPAECTVRIFTLAGDLIRTIRKNDSTSQLTWDLLTDNQLPVASGIYVYHVTAPGVGETTGKVAIFMEKERLNNF
jgi:hypothetical protein